MSTDWRKTIFNTECCSCGGSSGTGGTYETYNVAAQEIKFPLAVGEGYASNYEVRAVPVTPNGQLDGIVLTKIGNVVHLLIPGFQGDLAIGNTTNVVRVITSGDLPTRFLPTYALNFMVDAWNNTGLISVNQDQCDLIVDPSGNVDLISQTYLWNGNAGIFYDISVSWIVV